MDGNGKTISVLKMLPNRMHIIWYFLDELHFYSPAYLHKTKYNL